MLIMVFNFEWLDVYYEFWELYFYMKKF